MRPNRDNRGLGTGAFLGGPLTGPILRAAPAPTLWLSEKKDRGQLLLRASTRRETKTEGDTW